MWLMEVEVARGGLATWRWSSAAVAAMATKETSNPGRAVVEACEAEIEEVAREVMKACVQWI